MNNIFKHPYTKIEFVVNDLGVSKLTVANYLNKLAADSMLVKEKLGTGNYYINKELLNILNNGIGQSGKLGSVEALRILLVGKQQHDFYAPTSQIPLPEWQCREGRD